MTINTIYPCNTGNYTAGRVKNILYIVIHYVGATGNAQENCRYYQNNSGIQASAHYFVGHASENGAIYQSVSDENVAWHCGTTGAYKHPECRNSNSIGIEMCCHKNNDNTWYFDDITVDMTILLTKELMVKYGIQSENVIRHYDVTGKNCPAPYVENEDAWLEFKSRLIEEEDELASIIDKIAENTGKTQDEVIEALSVLVKFANVTEDDWEKQGVQKLKDMGIINSEHDARELIGFGSFGTMLERFKKTL